ncbi:MAG: TonB-dependent receptor domain-containing protein [Cytophagales bacterium]
MKWYILIISGLIHQFAYSQFGGSVIDRVTKQPIADAHVSVINSPLGTVTDNEGNFILDNWSADSVNLRISVVGYATLEYNIVKGELATIQLAPSTILLNNAVTVTAQRSERLSFDVAASTSTVNAIQLKELAPRSTPEMLMNETGVWVQKTNHGSGSPIIRGLVGNQILVMVDGIRLNNATYRYGPNQYLSTVDPGIIDRIEVNRGSGSVLYGSDALGGVVQVISATPSFSSAEVKVNGRVKAKWMSAGMEQSIRPEIEASGKRVAFLGGFSTRNFGDVLAGGELGVLKPTGYYERSGDAKLLLRTGSNGVLTAAFQQTTQRHVPRYDQVVQGGFSLYEFEPQTRQLSYLRYESSIRSRWIQSVRLTGSLSHSLEGTNSQKNNSADLKKQLDEANTLGILGEVQSNPTPNWHVQSGLEYYADHVSSRATLLNTVTAEETAQRGSYADGSNVSNLAIFTNHQLDIHKLQFSAGARFNQVTVSITDNTFGNQQINPSALVANGGIMYKINSKLRLIGLVNTGFRAPNVDDMSKFGAVEANVFEIPSEGLSPERSHTVETGIKFSGSKLSWALAAYQTNLTDLIDRMPATYNGSSIFDGRTVYQKQNVGEALVKGIEAEWEAVVVKSISIFGNITYTNGENETKKEPMRRIPPLFGKVGLRYAHPSGIWVRTEWAMAGKQDRLAAGDKSDVRIKIRLIDDAMPAWEIVNIYAGYSYKFLNVQISAQNVFDKAYRVYASGIDGYGRCMTASVSVRF